MKKYKIAYNIWWEAEIEIEENEKTIKNMKEQLLFFMGGQKIIDNADGNIVEAYLTSITSALIIESMEWNIGGVIDRFNNMEGYIPIDGSYGVRLVSIDTWEFSDNDFYIESIN